MVQQTDLFKKKSIQEGFESFLDQYPFVWELFKTQVFRAKRKRRKRIGAKAIIEWLRWECGFKRLAGEDFKINNNYTSRFSRKFKEEFPYLDIEFEERTIKTQ